MNLSHFHACLLQSKIQEQTDETWMRDAFNNEQIWMTLKMRLAITIIQFYIFKDFIQSKYSEFNPNPTLPTSTS